MDKTTVDEINRRSFIEKVGVALAIAGTTSTASIAGDKSLKHINLKNMINDMLYEFKDNSDMLKKETYIISIDGVHFLLKGEVPLIFGNETHDLTSLSEKDVTYHKLMELFDEHGIESLKNIAVLSNDENVPPVHSVPLALFRKDINSLSSLDNSLRIDFCARKEGSYKSRKLVWQDV